MPLGTLWRDPKVVSSKQAIAIRNVLQFAIQTELKVELDEVTIRVREFGPLDINYQPVEIEIDTGTGKGRWRVKAKKKLAAAIADRIFRSGVMLPEWIGPDKSSVWLRICESAFVPIGFPDHAR